MPALSMLHMLIALSIEISRREPVLIALARLIALSVPPCSARPSPPRPVLPVSTLDIDALLASPPEPSCAARGDAERGAGAQGGAA
eukprot:3392800-Prymnesium_polylepis.1